MESATTTLVSVLLRDGYCLHRDVFTSAECKNVISRLTRKLRAESPSDALRDAAGITVAARNVTDFWPEAAEVWRRPTLDTLIRAILGDRFGLVRVLYFDKPPERTWALPWHKDLTIAVRDNTRPSDDFRKPTRKNNVPHVEAPLAVLQQMVTLRLHLDDVTQENGPLKVLPGSHKTGNRIVFDNTQPHSILAKAGDVLFMRPLLAHSSGRSAPGTILHRRILHWEFAATRELADCYQWHEFREA